YIFITLIIFILSSCKNQEKENFKNEEIRSPNVLFILADDFGLKDMSFVGSSYYETPNIDRLASRSMVFNQGYAGSRVCSPSRATIMSGKFTARHGITNWIGEKSGEDWRSMKRHDKLLPAEYVHSLPKKDITIAEALQNNGYTTFFAGKWHLGDEGSYPEDHGFEYNIGGWDKGSPMGGYFSPFGNPKLKDKVNGENLSIRLSKETNDFISTYRDSTFFAFLSFYAVHGPIETTQEKWNKYREKAVSQNIADQGFKMEKKLPIRITQDNPVYAGLVETMDEAIGMVLDKLDELGLDDNTIIIFTSDNGGVSSGDSFSTSNLPFRGGKGYHWEGGIKEPFMIYVPGHTNKGKKSEYPVTGADFYPTILDYANIELMPNQHKDGISLKGLINENSNMPERSLFWHYPHYGNQGGDPSSVIRKGNWKLIHYYEENTNELYNLIEDPFEKQNLATSKPELAESLSKELMNWLIKVDARFPEIDKNFNADNRAMYDNKIRKELLINLEKERLELLDLNYEPSQDWWGSKITKD
ncbi:MAG: sulfatase, partial [Maribacter dokdonensis]|uniref:sulfatase n=1 Tax=Maribacter dokdonensis TaxID=320912 RepID=UPI0032992CA0